MTQTADLLALPRVPAPAPVSHPLRDRVLALMFVIAIALPGLALVRTATRTATLFENRPPAAWPQTAAAIASWSEFTGAFERAFADHFGGRNALIRVDHVVKAGVFGVSPVSNVMIGDDGWLFFLGEDGQSLNRHYRGVEAFTDDLVDAIARELARRQAALAARGIAYFVVVVPEKFTIYPEHLPRWVRRMSSTPLDRLVPALSKAGVHFVDLRPPLEAAKPTQRLYFQTDSHWNLLGASVGYRPIVAEMQRELAATRDAFRPAEPKLPPYVPGVDTYSGDLAQMLALPGRYTEPDYAPLGKVLGDPWSRCARRVDAPQAGAPDTGIETYMCDQPNLPRAVVFRDSMAIALIPLLSENFSRVVYVSSREMNFDILAREHPDIVIEEMVERSINAPAAFPIPDVNR
jgi:alginate O-acetyltransferase complex protein AlgJ